MKTATRPLPRLGPLASLFVLAIPALLTASAAEWRQFRGPSGQGVSSTKGLPTTWSSDQNILWKIDLPGPGGSSPVVLGDHIYVTCYSGNAVPDSPGGDLTALQRHVLCLQRTDGKILWKKDVPAAQPEQAKVRDHG